MTEAKKLWIAALRSGKYTQAKSTLRTRQGFCCLGVALDTMRVGEWVEWPASVFTFRADPSVADGKENIHRLSLPAKARDLLGINEDIEFFCIGMNDAQGKTFAEIADYLESLEASDEQ
jgi:hypothetical protein